MNSRVIFLSLPHHKGLVEQRRCSFKTKDFMRLNGKTYRYEPGLFGLPEEFYPAFGTPGTVGLWLEENWRSLGKSLSQFLDNVEG
jgi:hypothetical protein